MLLLVSQLVADILPQQAWSEALLLSNMFTQRTSGWFTTTAVGSPLNWSCASKTGPASTASGCTNFSNRWRQRQAKANKGAIQRNVAMANQTKQNSFSVSDIAVIAGYIRGLLSPL
eukprot:GHVS01041302.1.p1 GENE.GHVS01041302.1~~GHVS01041302.1.p1  ORF type:complete len:116 (-),score=4.79 GHVS01041302.1:369-716(-)